MRGAQYVSICILAKLHVRRRIHQFVVESKISVSKSLDARALSFLVALLTPSVNKSEQLWQNQQIVN